MKCPKCDTELSVKACIPDEQRFKLVIRGEGGMMHAENVGGIITNIHKLMKAASKEDAVKVETFVEDIKQIDGTLEVGFVVVTKERKTPPPKVHGTE